MSERLQKVLSRSGHGSRRKIENIIKQGRISINGKIAVLGDRVKISSSTKILIDNNIISIIEKKEIKCRVIAYYKPEGEICTHHDPEGRLTIFKSLPILKNSRWISVGRLDINTSGLLLLTNDGELANRLMHPSYGIEREYAVCVFGKISIDKFYKLTTGIQLEDGVGIFRSLIFKGSEGLKKWYTLTISEGRNREIRRMLKAVGVQVNQLVRIRYGNIILTKDLKKRNWKNLSLKQIYYLLKPV